MRAGPVPCNPDGSFSTLSETSCAQISNVIELCLGLPQSFQTNVWIVAYVSSQAQFVNCLSPCHSMLCMSWRSGSTSYRLMHTLLWLVCSALSVIITDCVLLWSVSLCSWTRFVFHFSSVSLMSRCTVLTWSSELEHLRINSSRNVIALVQAAQPHNPECCNTLTLNVAWKSYCLASGASAPSCRITPSSCSWSLPVRNWRPEASWSSLRDVWYWRRLIFLFSQTRETACGTVRSLLKAVSRRTYFLRVVKYHQYEIK